MGDVTSSEVLIVTPTPAAAASQSVLLSGHDLRRLLSRRVTIETMREAHAAVADNRADQGRSVGFVIEGGSIHALPGSHFVFASKVKVNLPDSWQCRKLPTIQGVVG